MAVNSIITGVGSYIPSRVIDNAYFVDHQFYTRKGEKVVKSAEAIVQKLQDISGIRERKYVDKNDDTAAMGARAAVEAIRAAGISAEELDGIIVAHNFGNIPPDRRYGEAIPNLAATIKNRLGIKQHRCFAYDLLFGCPGWIEGLIAAHQYLQNGSARRILVIGVELISRLLDPHDMDSMLFGDGAGAVVMSAEESDKPKGVLCYTTYSHCLEELDYLKMGDSNKVKGTDYQTPKMQGRMVYKYAVTHMPPLIYETLDKCGIDVANVSKFLFHQANEKMIMAIAAKIFEEKGIQGEIQSLVPFMVQEIGNSSVATIPTMLDQILKGKLPGHAIKPGDHVIMASVGAGMHCNCLLYTF